MVIVSQIEGEVKKDLYQLAGANYSIDDQSNDSSYILGNLTDTIEFGKQLKVRIPSLKILLLEGPLGVGKTSLVQGIAISLGINEPITSPTFALSQHYSSSNQSLIHMDLYRIEDSEEADELFLQEEELSAETGVLIVVEWPERLKLHLNDAWRIKLSYLPNNKRLANIQSPE